MDKEVVAVFEITDSQGNPHTKEFTGTYYDIYNQYLSLQAPTEWKLYDAYTRVWGEEWIVEISNEFKTIQEMITKKVAQK